jgi:RNA polymerase sigma factor (sigma-70 family)
VPVLPTLKNIARKMTKDPGFAAELVQDASLYIIRQANKWNPRKASKEAFAVVKAKDWMKWEVIRQYHKQHRRRSREGHRKIRAKSSRREIDALTRLGLVDEMRKIKQAVDELDISPMMRATYLYFIDIPGASNQERYERTATHFKVPEGTVKGRIHVIRKVLRKYLEEKTET